MKSFKNKGSKEIIKYILITVVIIAAATGIGWIFLMIGFPETNIVIVYLLSTTIYLWLIFLTASKALSILLLKLLECIEQWYIGFLSWTSRP